MHSAANASAADHEKITGGQDDASGLEFVYDKAVSRGRRASD